jgi:hypothetical protein
MHAEHLTYISSPGDAPTLYSFLMQNSVSTLFDTSIPQGCSQAVRRGRFVPGAINLECKVELGHGRRIQTVPASGAHNLRIMWALQLESGAGCVEEGAKISGDRLRGNLLQLDADGFCVLRMMGKAVG